MSVQVVASQVRLVVGVLDTIETDLLVIPLFEGDGVSALPAGVDAATGGDARRAVESGEAGGRLYDFVLSPVTAGFRARRVGLAGAGRREAFDLERLRKLAAAAGFTARKRRLARAAFVVPRGMEGVFSTADAVQAIAEGLALSSYSGDIYKSGERTVGPLAEAVVVCAEPGADAAALQRAAERGRILGESCNIAKSLCNEPSNVLTPREFADRAAAIGRDAGLGVEILDEHAIEKLKMGLLLGVARGSAEPPRVIVLKHEPASAEAPAGPPARRTPPVLGLVGKGITFDTGGISIKPADGMERMKDDMAGGAAVICAMRAISLLRAPIRVIGVVPATENMPGGRAIKPGDVLTGASGRTIEVINTDAEGRLILGDGLWYAQQLGATHLVDVATLTGACVVALGKIASGLFAQPDGWRDVVRATAVRAGDRCWPLPLYDEYLEQLKSEIADATNTGGRPAGACTAALFLREFTNGLPWAHLDIAGTAWSDENLPYQPKGATGVAVRTLAELAFTADRW